jgi:hypothetical protein
MANCLDYNCDDVLVDHRPNDCGEILLGGVANAIFLECNTQLTDPSSASQINAEIAAGRAKKITQVKMGFGAPNPIQIDNPTGVGPQILINYDHTGSLADFNVNPNNVDFYNTVNSGRKFGGLILQMTGTIDADAGEQVWFINSQVTFTGGPILPNQDNDYARFESSFAWRKKTSPTLHTAPVGIF